MPAPTTPPPLIPEMPPAPSRSEGQAAFNITSGPFIAAMPPMVVNINIALTWIGQQVTAIDGYRQAAAQSASDAAGSASAANTSKNAAAQSATNATTNGAAQVTLAAAQVTLANQARDSAQTAAAAAQSAAGLPSLTGNALKVLRVNSGATGVEWGQGIPALPSVAGAPGKVLSIAANGTSINWAELYKIGDIAAMSRNPGSLWLPADGSIRAQSAYPALFAALGLIGDAIGATWVAMSRPFTGPIASGANGTTIVVGATSISRSLDSGKTWGVAIAHGTTNPTSIGTDGKGTWIITANTTCRRSIDDGISWSSITLGGLASLGWYKATYAGGSNWVAIPNSTLSTVVAVSSDNGASWSTTPSGFGSATIADVSSDETGVVIILAGTNARRSSDFGVTYTSLISGAAQALQLVGSDKSGRWFIVSSQNLFISFNGGLAFSSSLTFPASGAIRILNSEAGTVFVFNGQTHYLFNKIGFLSSFTSPFVMTANTAVASVNILVPGDGSQRGLPYAYDSTTQFQLPLVPVISGIKSYIKAVEAAS